MTIDQVDFLQKVAPKSPLTLAALHLSAQFAASTSEAVGKAKAEVEEAGVEPEPEVAGEAPALSQRWLTAVCARRAPPLVNFLTIDGIQGMRSFLEGEGHVKDIGSFAIFNGIAPVRSRHAVTQSRSHAVTSGPPLSFSLTHPFCLYLTWHTTQSTANAERTDQVQPSV